MSEKIKLPETRQSVTHKFSIDKHEAYLIVGVDEQGQPMELFIKIAKQGSTLSGLLDGFCRSLSLALQYGLPLNKAVDAFVGMRFEPMGQTSNPRIPEARSILDYVVRYLDMTFPDGAAPTAVPVTPKPAQPPLDVKAEASA